MTTYRIELVRSPGLTEDERRRRLKQAFDVLLNFEIKETAGGDSPTGKSPAAIAPVNTRKAYMPFPGSSWWA